MVGRKSWAFVGSICSEEEVIEKSQSLTFLKMKFKNKRINKLREQ